MSSWAERVHRRAADFGSVVTSCGGHPGSSTPAYPYRLEKVKFGVPLEEVCKINDNIPGPLLVLILKLNKESPNKRDVFRAPGHQGAMKKLIHFLQTGRLVNVDNYSVYTIASVLKKFLRKIPNGIFGRSGEKELFTINELKNETEQTERLQRLLASLPKYTQHLLVLLFGTFRVIASNAAHAGTGMSSEALGVSVAPSFFQSCASDGKTARMEDVLKYKVATKIMQNIIDKFATHDLFGRENYEYYARVTGRILKVQDEWICSFQYPPPPRGKLAQQKYALQHSLEAEKTWLQCQCERWGLLAQEESRSTPALLTSSSSALENSVLSLGVSPEHSLFESCARLSVSLEGPGLFAMTSSPLHSDVDDDDDDNDNDDDDDEDDDFSAELEDVNRDHQYHHHQQAPYNLDSGDIQELDFDEKVIMRRYRQNNKKKTATKSMQMRNQRQRRLRAGTKSLDSAEHITVTSAAATTNLMPTTAGTSSAAIAATTSTIGGGAMCIIKSNELSGSTGALSSISCRIAKSPPMSVGVGGATTKKSTKKTRSCSRCNRGIRHASSCSSASASGGSNNANANANGSSMTLDELRAVNRYAESTKSLSFLPQVHERQAERMRTRSEWFLGPQDEEEVVALKLADKCVAGSYEALESNHKLIYQFLKMQHLHHHNPHHHQHHYQHQQQQEQQLQHQLNKSQPECMDIDESVMITSSSCCRTTTQFQHSTKAFLNSSNQLPLAAQCRPAVEHHGQRRLLLDANTVGTIRLSSSAESVRRPSHATRRLLINVPRQYPLRASLRRSKEKQMANNNNTASNTNAHVVVTSHGGCGAVSSGGGDNSNINMSGYATVNATQTNSLTATTTLIATAAGLNQRNSSPYKPPRI